MWVKKDTLDRTIKTSGWLGAVAHFYNQNTWEVEAKFGLRSSPTKPRAQAQLGLLRILPEALSFLGFLYWGFPWLTHFHRELVV